MFFKSRLYTYLIFSQLLLAFAAAKPRIPGLLQIPNGDILPHGQFHISSRTNVFNVMGADSSSSYKFPIAGSALIGLGDRAQVGVEYGNQVSLSFKTYLYEASADDFIPDVVVGARSIYGTQEGWLRGIEDKDSSRSLRNEAYVAISANLGKSTRIHGGASAMSAGPSNFPEGFFGAEQFLGGGVYLSYDFFQRFEALHHSLSLVYKFEEFFSFSLGFNEFQSWIYQDKKWGFYTQGPENTVNGYQAPGISVAISLGGWAIRGHRKTDKEKISELQKEQVDLKDDVLSMQKEVEKLKGQLVALGAKNSNSFKLENDQIVDYLDIIKRKINSDVPYDPTEIEMLRNKILKLGGSSKNILKKIVTNPTSDAEHRAQICIIMAMSNDGDFTEPLLKATADPEPRVRREAIISLGKMKLHVALEFAETLLEDPDETVAMAAKAAIKMIRSSNGEVMKEKGPPEVP